VWQGLHSELHPKGLTVVTIALDTDVNAARPFSDRAKPTHPSLIDPSLSLVDLFGITNVPFGLWIDEDGVIVRPAEVAFAPSGREGPSGSGAIPPGLPPERQKVIAQMTSTIGDTDRYAAAVRDWVDKGASSPFVMGPAEVVANSRARTADMARAAAEYELAQHLHRSGNKLEAVPHFQQAHLLDPENWSYPRNAFAIVDPEEMGNPYGTDLLTEVARVGPETFYPELKI
jgi:hypothetical protein